MYPEYPWDSNRFRSSLRVPSGHWRFKGNLLKALNQAETILGISSVSNFTLPRALPTPLPPFLPWQSDLFSSALHSLRIGIQ